MKQDYKDLLEFLENFRWDLLDRLDQLTDCYDYPIKHKLETIERDIKKLILKFK